MRYTNSRTSNPEIQKFMDNHKMTNNSELHAYFMTKVLPLLDQKSKPIVWQVRPTPIHLQYELYLSFDSYITRILLEHFRRSFLTM